MGFLCTFYNYRHFGAELIFAPDRETQKEITMSTDLPEKLVVTHEQYKPDVGEEMLTMKGNSVYYSHNQYETYAKGFVCCDDKSMPDRGNYSCYNQLIPLAKNWTEKLKIVETKANNTQQTLNEINDALSKNTKA
jgi:hypothetical protein